MIIYGLRSSSKVGDRLVGATCPKCNSTDLFGAKLFRYVHIYWVPFIPLPAQNMLVCNACSNVATGKDIPDGAKSAIDRSAQVLKRPFTHFIGLILALLIAANVSAYYMQKRSKVAEYAKSPAVGDVYVIDMSKVDELKDMVFMEKRAVYKYVLGKINRVEEGLLSIDLTELAYTSESKASSDKTVTYDVEHPVVFPVKHIPQFVENGAITEIKRD